MCFCRQFAPTSGGERDGECEPCASPITGLFPPFEEVLAVTTTHRYRTHTCGQLRIGDAGGRARLSGWVHRKRDHGNLLFIDLRDHYGVTQCLVEAGSMMFAAAAAVRPESVVTVTGEVVPRSPETVNRALDTGEIELRIEDFQIESAAQMLPLQVAGDAEAGEDLRLRYRFLDLRRDRLHRNILLRSQVNHKPPPTDDRRKLY